MLRTVVFLTPRRMTETSGRAEASADTGNANTRHPDFRHGCASTASVQKTGRPVEWAMRGAKQWQRTVGNEMDEIVRAE
ncbi:MAG: hypothetical protein ACOC7K_00850 [bacterium]